MTSEAAPARFVVGLDLGTSNCALAFVDLDRGPGAVLEDFPIPQLQAPGVVGSEPTLPSAAYLPALGEFPEGSLRMPWEEVGGMVVGEFARRHGSRVPGRLVVSAKSWLCHAGVDRTAPILPWGAPDDVVRVSPVEASAAYLAHLAQAWDAAHPGHPLSAQEVILTVPASFDAVARGLTVEAARRAGLTSCRLVEEPQAAFQAFAFESERTGELDVRLEGVRLVLVVDVGGGTTDFTLVRVERGETGPGFERLAVGNHLMLGGDNMDAALARCAEERLMPPGRRLPGAGWGQLLQAAREAKERLLAESGPGEVRVSVAGQGRALMGGTLESVLTRSDVEDRVVEGFFPRTGPEDRPSALRRVALQEMGLPYAQDPAISRHLAAFLQAHRAAGWGALGEPGGRRDLPRPDAILLNGGVFRAGPLARRLTEVVSAWWPDRPRIPCLQPASLDLAVARGAACHGLARRGGARKMSGGSSHAFHVGLERDPRAGESGAALALCVIPRGQEEGTTVDLRGRVFRLSLGRPVQFPLFTSTSEGPERAGDLVEVSEEWIPLPPLHAVLRDRTGRAGEREVPVHLQATLTEIGTLELWCVAEEGGERWRLEFELRGEMTGDGGGGGTRGAASSAGTPVVEAMPARFDQARRAVEEAFPPKSAGKAAPRGSDAGKAAKQLGTLLERSLGPREDWRPAVLRELWGTLWAGASRRRRSVEQERAFYQWAGYALRPGFGYPLDDWRSEQMAGLFREGVQFAQERMVWGEFWVAWRRIAGGLTSERQGEMWQWMKPHLAHRIDPKCPRHLGRPKGVQPEGTHEMVRLAASLEHLPVAEKEELGGWLLAQLADPSPAGGPWAWALGRLGSRVPLYGSLHQTVSPGVAEAWGEGLVEGARRGIDGALFALAQVTRRSGDRTRDVGDGFRQVALEALTQQGATPAWIRMVTEVVVLEQADAARALGDTLPVGLRI